MKTDSNGNKQWNRTFGGAEGNSGAKSVQQTADGGYVIAGSTRSCGAGGGDMWLVKTDSNGNEQWNRTFGGTEADVAHAVQQTSGGGYILAGFTRSHRDGGWDVWLVKTDPNGNEQWNQIFGGTGYDAAHSVRQTDDGGYIVAGETESYGAMGEFRHRNSWLVKTDPNGNEQWNLTFGGIADDGACSVQQTADGGYVIAGHTQSYGAGGSDVWLIKLEGAPI